MGISTSGPHESRDPSTLKQLQYQARSLSTGGLRKYALLQEALMTRQITRSISRVLELAFNCSKITNKYIMKYSVGAQCCFRALPAPALCLITCTAQVIKTFPNKRNCAGCTSPFIWRCFTLLNVLVWDIQFQLSEELETLYYYFFYLIVLKIKTSISLHFLASKLRAGTGSTLGRYEFTGAELRVWLPFQGIFTGRRLWKHRLRVAWNAPLFLFKNDSH